MFLVPHVLAAGPLSEHGRGRGLAEHGGREIEMTDVRVGCSWGGGALAGQVGEELVKLCRGLRAQWRATEK